MKLKERRMDDLVKRLRATEGLPDGYGNFSRLRNPDGLEAADRIEQLEEALEKERQMSENMKDKLIKVEVKPVGLRNGWPDGTIGYWDKYGVTEADWNDGDVVWDEDFTDYWYHPPEDLVILHEPKD